jgi:hypothetical protein
MKNYASLLIALVLAFSVFRVSAQSAPAVRLFSFRGVLSGILEEIKNEAENIISRNPFSAEKKTEPPVNQTTGENSFSFAVIGDTQRFSSGNPNGYFQKTVNQISKDNVDLVLAMGDLTGTCESYTECVKDHEDWKKIMSPLLSKTYAAMGNHDNFQNKGTKAWQDVFNFPNNGPDGHKEMTYSFDFKNSHFVILDSDEPDEHQVDEAQRAWLDRDLAANSKETTFVIFHEPAWPVSSKISESLDKQAGQRDALWSIITKHKVTAVFNGHEHIVSRRKIGDVYQFVFGSTDSFDHDLPARGVAEYSNRGQGRFGIVSVAGKEVTVKTFTTENQELNSFTFTK